MSSKVCSTCVLQVICNAQEPVSQMQLISLFTNDPSDEVVRKELQFILTTSLDLGLIVKSSDQYYIGANVNETVREEENPEVQEVSQGAEQASQMPEMEEVSAEQESQDKIN
ncbi:uncharacterized protein LOC115628843 [Scaptodrosophila lebanonensis]|uniref:Uncharacterized protein LOC115628843 n=1 Tax=Drosophila lebanonensis TaxID=7225 RepID=A0A6J2TXU5_DROLE|nr:uncharacterized protein LOC115628843 [Scaptodrosophila lebanonensis]